jgi:hypothetical protein
MTIRGYIDAVRNNAIQGWAAAIDDRSGEHALIAVEALLEGKGIVRARADQFRADLKRDGIGTGRHGFELRLPSYLRNGGPFLIQVCARGPGAAIVLGQVVVLRGEAVDAMAPRDEASRANEADLDAVLAHIRSVSLQVVLSHAEEVRAEVGDAALVAYLFGRLLERMPDREAYESYVAGLTLGVLDAKGLMAEILQSQEYKSR